MPLLAPVMESDARLPLSGVSSVMPKLYVPAARLRLLDSPLAPYNE